MKKKNIIMCAVLGMMAIFNVACDDDDMKQSSVPEVVYTAFQDKYPGATAEWEQSANGLLKADFYFDSHAKEAWFKIDGTWVKTITELAPNELPQDIRDYISTNYPTGQIDDSNFVETPEENHYVVEVDRQNASDIYLTLTETGELIVS